MSEVKLTEAQQEARLAILRDVADRFGGSCTWSRLHDRGHHYKQVMACVSRDDLNVSRGYTFTISSLGRSALAPEIKEGRRHGEG